MSVISITGPILLSSSTRDSDDLQTEEPSVLCVWHNMLELNEGFALC